MDFGTLSNDWELRQELATLKRNSFFVDAPHTIQIIESEITRAMETLEINEPGNFTNTELRIDHILNELEFKDIKVLREQLEEELGLLKFCFHPPLDRICGFVSIVVRHLGQKLLKEYFDENSRVATGGPEPDSVGCCCDGAPASFQKTEIQDTPPFPDTVADATDTSALDSPQVNLVIEPAPTTNVDDEDVKKLIYGAKQ